MNDLSAVRDQVRERADIVDLAERAGFRRRGRVWLCGFHEDRTPSASIRNRRAHCFVCNRSWDAIDLVRKMHGLDYVRALKLLAAELFIPWPDENFTSEQRAVYARRRRQAQESSKRLARLALFWWHGLVAELRDLKAAALDLDAERIDVAVLGATSRALYRLERLTASEVLAEYERFEYERSEECRDLVRIGEIWENFCRAACVAALAKLDEVRK